MYKGSPKLENTATQFGVVGWGVLPSPVVRGDRITATIMDLYTCVSLVARKPGCPLGRNIPQSVYLTPYV